MYNGWEEEVYEYFNNLEVKTDISQEYDETMKKNKALCKMVEDLKIVQTEIHIIMENNDGN
jgi:hypothetical protein